MPGDKDESQQTEEPTAKRLEQAREQGDVIKSMEVTGFVVLAGSTLALAMLGKQTMVGLAGLLTMFLEQPDQLAVDGAGLSLLMHHLLVRVGIVLAPLFGVFALAAIAGHVLQSLPGFTPSKLAPDFSKVSPMAGFKRLFGLDGWMNLVKGLAKIAIVGIAVWTQLWPARGMLSLILDQSPGGLIADMGYLLFKVLIAALSALAVIAAADYFLQRMQFMKRNRMSKQEIKEEFRQNEGDPHVKAKIRQLRQERSRQRMMARVPEATVVLMNPTHYAVALQYKSGEMAAPICVAKGVDALALRIRAVAEDNDVPVIENPPLARALHASVELDEPVPPEHYKAVAQVIGYVMRLQGAARKRA
jgi:flagellar biosynthetic protein FlhB